MCAQYDRGGPQNAFALDAYAHSSYSFPACNFRLLSKAKANGKLNERRFEEAIPADESQILGDGNDHHLCAAIDGSSVALLWWSASTPPVHNW